MQQVQEREEETNANDADEKVGERPDWDAIHASNDGSTCPARSCSRKGEWGAACFGCHKILLSPLTSGERMSIRWKQMSNHQVSDPCIAVVSEKMSIMPRKLKCFSGRTGRMMEFYPLTCRKVRHDELFVLL